MASTDRNLKLDVVSKANQHCSTSGRGLDANGINSRRQDDRPTHSSVRCIEPGFLKWRYDYSPRKTARLHAVQCLRFGTCWRSLVPERHRALINERYLGNTSSWNRQNVVVRCFGEETGVHVGFCPVLKVYSQGRTEKEAEDAVLSAVTFFIGTCYERDILHNVLRKRGLKKVNAKQHVSPAKRHIVVSGFDRVIERSVSLELLSSIGEEVLCR